MSICAGVRLQIWRRAAVLTVAFTIGLGIAAQGSVSVLGSATVGETLSLGTVRLTGISPISFSVQWLRNGTAISGATGAAYVTQSADIGQAVSAQVTLPDGTAELTSNTITVTDVAAPVITVPGAFGVGMWGLADQPSAGGDRLALTLSALPPSGGAAITALQYSLNGGAWLALTGIGTGVRTITVPAAAAADIRVRAVNAQGAGLASDTKSATPTVLSGSATVVTLNDFSRDRVVFDTGAAIDRSVADLPLSGTADPGAAVEYRVVTETGAEVQGWADLAIADGGGAWSAVATAPRDVNWLRPEVRLKADPAIQATTANRFAAGHVIALWGQSEFHRAIMSSFSHVQFGAPIADGDALQVTCKQGGTPDHVFIDQATIDASARFDALGAMANTFATVRPGEKFHVVMQTLSGTGLVQTVDDTADLRDWTDWDLDIHTTALADGQVPGLLWMSWYSADAAIHGANMTNHWLVATLGKDASGAAVSRGGSYSGVRYDHFLSDLYDFSRTPIVISGPHRFENNTYQGSLPAVRNAWEARFDPATTNPTFMEWQSIARRGGEIITYLNAQGDIAHPASNDADGYQRLFTYAALDMLQEMGLGSWPTSAFDGAALAPDGTYVEVWSSAGAVTTTNVARAAAPALATRAVWGFYLDNTLADHTEIVAGRVRIYQNAARDPIPSGTVLTFANGNVGDDGNPTGSWADYPVIDMGQPLVPGIAIRPNTSQDVLDVIPDASLPPDPNTNPHLGTDNFRYMVQNGGAWSTPAQGWSFDTTSVIDPGNTAQATTAAVNRTQFSTPRNGANAAGFANKNVEISFVLTSPDAATGRLRVFSFVNGVLALDEEFTPVVGGRNTLPVPLTLPGNVNEFSVRWQRRGASTGTFVFSDVTVKERP